MNLEKLNPWNWFQHEEGVPGGHQIPVSMGESGNTPSLSGPGSLLQLHRDMDRWFDGAFGSFGLSPLSRRMSDKALSDVYRPQIDVSGDSNAYEIKLDVPDMSEDDISVEVKGDMLLIKGKKESSSKEEDKDKHYYRVERSYGSFQRTLSLPDDANADEINADLDKGVLKLTIPRRELPSSGVKQIPISS